MVLLARSHELKLTIVVVGILAIAIALMIAAPIFIIRELRRKPDEQLPEWMGSASGRRIRVAVIFGLIGLIAAGITAWQLFSD